MIPVEKISKAAKSLYWFILDTHWNAGAIEGPDPGIRINARVGRFIKNYFSFWPWSDNLVYVQAQSYWILNNWLMADLGLEDSKQCEDVALACTEYLISKQHPQGYWQYPNREWKGRIATVEGNYAAVGLLASYVRVKDERFLNSAVQWYKFATEQIGFQKINGGLAINYFCKHKNSALVPNVSVSFLRMLAFLAKASGDNQYLYPGKEIVHWLKQVQLKTGEIPYAVAAPGKGPEFDRIHFLCYQYNAFQFLNLTYYYELTKDKAILPILKKLARFVAEGVRSQGALRYDCHRQYPEVPYYAIAAGAALRQATKLGLNNYTSLVHRIYKSVLSRQKSNGGMAFYSQKNYGLLTDRRSYPRYLAMILQHLLIEIKTLRNNGYKTPI